MFFFIMDFKLYSCRYGYIFKVLNSFELLIELLKEKLIFCNMGKMVIYYINLYIIYDLKWDIFIVWLIIVIINVVN